MVDQQDPRVKGTGFGESIRTAVSVLEVRGYGRALKTLRRMLENSQSRPPRSSQDTGGHDTSKEAI
jgi:hypothetical protein